MRVLVRRMGNSKGIILPRPILADLGVTVGDDLAVPMGAGRVILTPAEQSPRAGWAEAAGKIAEAGEDALAWSGFANEDDDNWAW